MTKHENTERPDTVVRPFAERFHPGAFVKEDMNTDKTDAEWLREIADHGADAPDDKVAK